MAFQSGLHQLRLAQLRYNCHPNGVYRNLGLLQTALQDLLDYILLTVLVAPPVISRNHIRIYPVSSVILMFGICGLITMMVISPKVLGEGLP